MPKNNDNPIKQLDEAKQKIEDLKIQLEYDTDVAEEMAYTDEEIQKLLKKLPVVMFQAAQSVVIKLMDYKEAKRKLKKEYAIAMMKAQHQDDLSAAEDRKAWANDQDNVEQAEIDLINAEAEYKMAEFHLNAYDNLYMAIKKLVEMRMEQNKAQDNADRSYRKDTPQEQK